MYKQNVQSTGDNLKTMQTFSILMLRITKCMFIVYLGTGICFSMFPLLFYLFLGYIEPALPIFIPFIDFQSTTGFTIHTVYHTTLLFCASLGFSFTDALILNLVLCMLLLADLIRNRLKSLSADLKEKKHSKLEIRKTYRDILVFHREHRW